MKLTIEIDVPQDGVELSNTLYDLGNHFIKLTTTYGKEAVTDFAAEHLHGNLVRRDTHLWPVKAEHIGKWRIKD